MADFIGVHFGRIVRSRQFIEMDIHLHFLFSMIHMCCRSKLLLRLLRVASNFLDTSVASSAFDTNQVCQPTRAGSNHSRSECYL